MSKRFFVHSGINLLLVIGVIHFIPMDPLPGIIFVTLANVIGWLEGRLQERAER